MTPAVFSHVRVGDTLTVKEEYLTRGGQSGTVTEVFGNGAALDFFRDVFGDPKGLPTIEYWEWGELDPDGCGMALLLRAEKAGVVV